MSDSLRSAAASIAVLCACCPLGSRGEAAQSVEHKRAVADVQVPDLVPMIDGYVYGQSIRCSWGIAEQCSFTGEAYHLGMGVPRDLERALMYFRRACSLGSVDGCVMTGFVTVKLRKQGEYANVLANWEQACEKGSYAGCGLAGATLSTDPHKMGTPLDVVRGRQYLAKACSARDMTACGMVAALIIEQKETSSYPAARAQLTEACQLHERQSCHYLGQSELDGTFGAVDVVSAGDHFLQACNDGWGASCSALADLHERGIGTPVDLVKARKLNVAACTLGHQPACETSGKSR